MLALRAHVHNGQVAIRPLNNLAQCRNQRCWRKLGANGICHAAYLRLLHIRQEELRRRIVAQVRVAVVATDADNLDPHRLVVVGFEPPANGIDAREPLLCQRLVNDGNLLRAHRVLRTEAAPANDRDAHGLEECVANHVQVLWIVVARGRLFALDREFSVRHIVREIGRPARRHALDSRQCRKLLLQPLVQRDVLARAIAMHGRRNLKQDQVVCAEAGVDPVER